MYRKILKKSLNGKGSTSSFRCFWDSSFASAKPNVKSRGQQHQIITLQRCVYMHQALDNKNDENIIMR